MSSSIPKAAFASRRISWGSESAWRSFNRQRLSGCEEHCSTNTALTWTISNGTPWTPHSRMEMQLPKRYSVTHISPDRKPDQMLFDGEIDAMICASLFPSLLNPPPHVRRLFENYEEVEASYFKKTGIFPIMHSVAI